MPGRRSIQHEDLYHDNSGSVGHFGVLDSGDQDVHVPSRRVDARMKWVAFMLGCAVQLPWTASMNYFPYFLSRLEDLSLQYPFLSYLSFVHTSSSLVFSLHSTVTVPQANPARRIHLSALTLAFSLFLLALSTFTRLPPVAFISFIFLNVFLQAAAGQYFHTSCIAVSSLFGPAAVQILLSGQAAVEVVVSGVQAWATRTTAPPAASKVEFSARGIEHLRSNSAFWCLGLSAIFLVAITGAHAWSTRMSAYKFSVRHPLEERSGIHGPMDEARGLVNPGTRRRAHGNANSWDRVWRVAKENLIYEAAAAYVSVVTLSVFSPTVVGTRPNMHPFVFSASELLVFSLGDLLGRPLLHTWSAKQLLLFSTLRTLFIPIFLWRSVRGFAAVPASAAPLIPSDMLDLLLISAFGWTNGYVSSLCIMSASSLEHNPRLKGCREDVDVAATLVSFCIIIGMTVGSLASFGVTALVCGCNPFVV